jgi:hypothetical protein
MSDSGMMGGRVTMVDRVPRMDDYALDVARKVNKLLEPTNRRTRYSGRRLTMRDKVDELARFRDHLGPPRRAALVLALRAAAERCRAAAAGFEAEG